MQEAYMYCAFGPRFSIYCLKVNFFSVVISSIKTSSLASTLIEFIFNICIFQGWLLANLI